MSDVFILYKLSDKGFVLESTHEEVIVDVLLNYICKDCVEVFDSTYTGIERVQNLLASPCGAEFMLRVLGEN